MMMSVVLDGNPLDEDDGNLLDELGIDVNLMYRQLVQKEMMKGISVCIETMIKRVYLKAYTDLSTRSSVCTRDITCQVAYGKKRSKSVKPRVTTMVLTHCIER